MGCFSKVKNGIRSTAFTYFRTKNILSSVCPKPTHFLVHHIGNDCYGSKPQLHPHFFFFYNYLDSENKKKYLCEHWVNVLQHQGGFDFHNWCYCLEPWETSTTIIILRSMTTEVSANTAADFNRQWI